MQKYSIKPQLKTTAKLGVRHLGKLPMFVIGSDYTFFEIKEKIGVKEGNTILKRGKDFVGLCLEKGTSFIEPNLMLVKNGSLIKK